MKFGFRALSAVIPFLLIGIATLVVCDLTQVSSSSHQALNNLVNDLHVGLIPLLLFGCTRAIYSPKNGEFITVRSMDWSDADMPLSLWVSPRPTDSKPIKRVGANKNLAEGEKALEWEAKYGSVILCNYEKATTDGMNEKGLVANLLFLPNANYRPYDPTSSKQGLAISGWPQYVLDKYATVEEAVKDLEQEPFRLITDAIMVPYGDVRTKKEIVVHLIISDATGDSAVFQHIYDNDKHVLKVYRSPKYKVVTNSLYDSQLKILEDFGKDPKNPEEINWDSASFSWDAIKSPGQEKKDMTPPMNGAQIRFIRASFYSNMIEQISNDRKRYPRGDFQEETQGWPEPWSYEEGIARAFSLIRNMSTPLNVKSNLNPFLSSTLWRTVADQTNKRYFFESARSIYPLYIDLPKVLEGLDTFKKLDLYLSPRFKDDPEEINLQKDQMESGNKMGKIDGDAFEKVDEWFEFDPLDPHDD